VSAPRTATGGGSRAGGGPGRSRSRIRGAAGAVALACGGLLGAPVGAEETQPSPPLVFFTQPDTQTAADIEELVDTSFGDVTKVVAARDALVRRFGVLAVPALVARVEAGANETLVRNSVLTLALLRERYGPCQYLWPGIRPLVKTLAKEGSDPWRRVFAALALGTFYGPQTVRRGGLSREGTRAGAEKAVEDLVAGNAALVRALSDSFGPVASAAALAIGKIGGMELSTARAVHRKSFPLPATPEAHVADLLSLGLLRGDEDVALALALKDADKRIRAAAALAVACWAVAESEVRTSRELPGALAARAHEMETLLEPSQNSLLRMNDWDGAEAIFARAALALLTGRMETWEEIYAFALTTAEPKTAVAAAQALLFAPVQSPVRGKMAEMAGRPKVGSLLQAPVLGAFLLVAGEDGTPIGVKACRQFLRDRSREPRARVGVDYDVRYYAAIGLVRGLLLGRIAPESRGTAIDALREGRDGLVPGEPHGFRERLEDLAKPLAKAFANDPDARPDANAAGLLQAAFDDPDALVARDPIDVAVHRLNRAVDVVFGLDALPKAVAGAPGGPRTPSREDQELRFLLGWLDAAPYFTRLDLLRDRGRIPVPPPVPGRDRDREVDR